MKLKIFFLVFIVILAAMLYFAFGIIKERDFNEAMEESPTASLEEIDASIDASMDSSKTNSGETVENDKKTDKTIGSDEVEYFGIEEKGYCDEECNDFTESPEKDKCLKICGFVPIEKRGSKPECDSLGGSEKYFCLMDLAVSKIDLNICKEIEDDTIKNACKNRITEEILDESRIE